MNPQSTKSRKGSKFIPVVVAGLLIGLYMGTNKSKPNINYAQDISGSTAVQSDQQLKRGVMDATAEVFLGATFILWRFGSKVDKIDSFQVDRAEDLWELQDRYFSIADQKKGTRFDLVIEAIVKHSTQEYIAVIVTDGENTGLPLDAPIHLLQQDPNMRAVVVVFLTPEARLALENDFKPLGNRFFPASPQNVDAVLRQARDLSPSKAR